MMKLELIKVKAPYLWGYTADSISDPFDIEFEIDQLCSQETIHQMMLKLYFEECAARDLTPRFCYVLKGMLKKPDGTIKLILGT